jgi:hypothetical protein
MLGENFFVGRDMSVIIYSDVGIVLGISCVYLSPITYASLVISKLLKLLTFVGMKKSAQ